MRHTLRSLSLASHLQFLLVLSGFSALALEIIYTRQLRYWVGSTAFATAVVLSSYMLGLALGSFLAGRMLPRLKNLLVVYGVLELSIGLYSVCYPWVVKFVESTYIRMTIGLGMGSGATLLGQFVTSVLLLMFPTLLMGMSFPIAVRAASGGLEDQPGIADKLYTANLSGAALGALISDFVLVPFWGLGSSLLFAAAINATVGIWVFALNRACPQTSGMQTVTDKPAMAPPPQDENRVVMFVALAGGFLVLFQEVVWNHMIGEFLDNSAYGFATMLFAVIAGLGVGAGLSARYLVNRRVADWLPGFCLGAGVLSMLLNPFWDNARALTMGGAPWSAFVAVALLLFVGLILAPEGMGSAIAVCVILSPAAAILIYSWLNPVGATFWIHLGVNFCVSVLFMLGPAVLMGFIFPLVLQWWLGLSARSGHSVALVYGANTLGSLLGIIAATFLSLPWVGVELSGRLVAIAFFTLGVWLIIRGAGHRWAVALAIIPILAWSIWFPRWDFSKIHAALGHRGKMVFAEENLDGGVTSVLQEVGTKQLYSNGVYEAGNDYEVYDQARLALVPLIHARDHGSAMVIGLGSGQTAGIVGLFPFKEITLVDFSPAVFKASRQFFGDLNQGVLDDRRTMVRVEDGRHYLLLHPQRIDLLTIEVTRLWVAGEGDLYTKEFYELCSSRLTDRGVLQQWVPLFNLSQADTLMILRTIRSAFPHVTLYMGAESGMVVASRQPLQLDYPKLKGMDSHPQVQAILQKLGMPSILSLLGDCVLDDRGLDELMARTPDKRISTDLWPYLEYSNARKYLGDRSAKPLRQFLFNAQVFRVIPLEGADAGTQEAVGKLALEEHRRLKDLVNSP